MAKRDVTYIHIEHLVYFVKGEKVMLDTDLAAIYGVETKLLNRAVKRNLDRFPKDFMFQLTQEEWDSLRFQIGTLKKAGSLRFQNNTLESSQRGKHRKYLPYVFTEHGAVMLASVLNSPQAIAASVQVVRVFIKLREILATHKQLAHKLQELEEKYDSQFSEVFTALRELMNSHYAKREKFILNKGVKE